MPPNLTPLADNMLTTSRPQKPVLRASQKLTKRVIDAATPDPDNTYCVWDTELKGFRLRVHPSGRKCFELYYRVGRRQRLLKIGDYGAFTPEQARKAAEKAKYEVGTGGDPQYEKETIRKAANVAELIALYLKEGRIDKPNKREVSWKTDETYLRCHVAPLLGTRGLFELKTVDIAKWQADVIAGKTARVEKMGFRRKSNVRGGRGVAGRATRCLATMFAWAVKREIMSDNPAQRVAKIPDKQRERFLTDEEAVTLFTTLEEMEQCGEVRPDFADLFRLLALTGARLAEIRDLAWTEIDRANRMIVLEPNRHKTGRTGRKVINLNTPALEILERRANGTDWVFPKTPPYTGPIETPRRVWNLLATRAKFPGLRIHDLRHTFASLLIKDGHALSFVQKALGHSRPEVTARYAHLKDEATRAAFDHVGAIYSGVGKEKAA